jgi:uncharacterized Zn-binding protein involved in type VI secretion
MGKPAARMGDPTAHGGVIMTGFPTVLIGGMPAARLTDMHTCPFVTPGVPPIPHVGGPISGPGVPTVLIGGMPAACLGDMAVCVGPPSTIIMGCPTVLIGPGGGGGGGGGAGSSGAGSAQTSAKQALTDNVESKTKEEHWIEFEFKDKAGNLISGLPYKLKDPDSKESKSILKTQGKILRDAVGKGKGEVTLYEVHKAKWSKEIAKVGDKVKLSAETMGYENGKKAIVQIYKRDLTGPDTVVKTFEKEISNNKIEFELENKFEEETGNKNTENNQYSSAGYYFEVIVDQSKSRSDLLFNEDFIEIELKDDEGNPIANEEFIVYLPSGKVETGKLDSNGYKKLEKIPAGNYSVKFPNLEQNED